MPKRASKKADKGCWQGPCPAKNASVSFITNKPMQRLPFFKSEYA